MPSDFGPLGVRTAIDSSLTGTGPWGYITGVYNQGDNLWATGSTSVHVSGSAVAADAIDFSVMLWMSGTVGSNLAQQKSITLAEAGEGTLSYSGSWGLRQLTYQDTNDPEFGFAWAALATGTNGGQGLTHYLVAKNFGFDLPTGSVVVSVSARVWPRVTAVSPGAFIYVFVDYMDMEVLYTHDRYFIGVQSTQGLGVVTF